MIALVLVFSLGVESVYLWIGFLRHRDQGLGWLEKSEEPRATWNQFSQILALGLAFLMFASHIASGIDKTLSLYPAEKPLPTTDQLVSNLVFGVGVTLVLIAILISSARASDYGFRFRSLSTQVRDGIQGFLFAILPTGALVLLTALVRTKENQNSLLSFLQQHPDPSAIVLVFATAVVLAPLYEELLFRVILQGWLSNHLKPGAAISITAVVFCLVHGPIDGIALLPLALVLGILFDRRHSYLSVVVIHALFNATMLTLTLLSPTEMAPPTGAAVAYCLSK